jgi:hypothetical protein
MGHASFRYATRAYPEAHAITRAEPYTVEYRLNLTARAQAITLGIVWAESCPWQISAIEGASFAGALPASSVELLPGPAGGTITFRKRYDARSCPKQELDRRFLPCVFETLPGEEGIFSLAQRIR